MSQLIEFNKALIQKYDVAGPRYTSYPTAVQFHNDFSQQNYEAQAALSNYTAKNISLYFHLPFCDTICFYCACNKIATKNRELVDDYLQYMYKEMQMHSALLDKDNRVVEQLHWGGGTPTFLNQAQMQALMDKTREYFQLLEDRGEYSIEIDPREANADTIKFLKKIGFNRLSLGVQDFNLEVQKAVNRVQTEQETFAVIEAAREAGFYSISIDLIYGLPLQTHTSFLETLEKVVSYSPDRLSIFNYAHLPDRFKPQRRINEQDLPSPEEKLAILQTTIQFLQQQGYVYIGMDHFAKPNDHLAIAQREGTLYRNFQGYSTYSNCDLVGIGVSSISMVNDCYSQNVKEIEEYYKLLDQDQLPIHRGLLLTEDDKIRRAVITELICNFSLNMHEFSIEYQIDFHKYFAKELALLKPMQQDNLLLLDDNTIEITSAGRLLIRNICMVFDAYLAQQKVQYSKVI